MNYPPPPQWGPPQPPARPRIGCGGLLFTAIALPFVCLLGFCGYVFSGVGAPKTAAEKDAEAQLQAENAANREDAAVQLAKRQEPWKAKTRTACGLKPDAPIYPASTRELAKMCVDLVKDGLKVPGSGKFPELPSESETGGLVTPDGCRYSLDSYVDAQNAFGVVVRTRYRCSYDPTTGVPSYKML